MESLVNLIADYIPQFLIVSKLKADNLILAGNCLKCFFAL